MYPVAADGSTKKNEFCEIIIDRYTITRFHCPTYYYIHSCAFATPSNS